MSTFSFASIISALKNTGASSSTIASAVQGLGLGNSWSSQAKADLTAIAAASADPTEISNPPACTSSGAVGETGTSTTECQTPGNVEISAAAPDVPTWSYPFDDGFYWSP